ncbi:carboxypeptidase Q [Mytilus galloprovincialis]|uniref:Carboxypeptidase Q n=1 Tax=Mytilus galloprovincialis TaxID=29158 RepID=A0A8B6G952_MYTGA|nr:carboxypeptidase Q [Mytilus galloprovincialis]
MHIFLLLNCFLFPVIGRYVETFEQTPLTQRFLDVHDEVNSYQEAANAIINLSVHGRARNQSYDRLATFVDKFGSRIAGSQNLENAIDYMLDELQRDGLDNVHGEDVTVPHWVRGEEYATMLEPRNHKLAMLGLGSSIATPEDGITAEVLVVRSFDELHQKAAQAKGKIIVFNQKWVSYGISVAYRSNGAVEAAKVGGVASLIRSVTPLSINSPHTGWQDYVDDMKKIPTACITVEDAEMMDRMQQRGHKIVVKLKMSAKTLPSVTSRNTIAEIKGSTYPEQIVLVSGHLDSWDVGQGAMDDGGGAFISWQALSLIKQLGLRPKRTIRLVMWTAEEEGGFGGNEYYNRHKKDIANYDMVLESDMGTFTALGMNFQGNPKTMEIMGSIVNLLKPINATALKKGEGGEDITLWMRAGVPGGSIMNANEKYFYFHHTDGDTMTVQDPVAMNLCSAVWAVVAYTVADLEEMLPR